MIYKFDNFVGFYFYNHIHVSSTSPLKKEQHNIPYKYIIHYQSFLYLYPFLLNLKKHISDGCRNIISICPFFSGIHSLLCLLPCSIYPYLVVSFTPHVKTNYVIMLPRVTHLHSQTAFMHLWFVLSQYSLNIEYLVTTQKWTCWMIHFFSLLTIHFLMSLISRLCLKFWLAHVIQDLDWRSVCSFPTPVPDSLFWPTFFHGTFCLLRDHVLYFWLSISFCLLTLFERDLDLFLLNLRLNPYWGLSEPDQWIDTAHKTWFCHLSISRKLT